MADIGGIDLVVNEHVQFLLRPFALGAPEITADLLAEHASNPHLLAGLRRAARSPGSFSITDVAENGDELVVSAESTGERSAFGFRLDGDGRVSAMWRGRIVDGVEFSIADPTTLSTSTRDELQAVFANSYTEPDPGYLDLQFETMDLVSFARRGDRLVAFALRGQKPITTTRLGTREVFMPGLSCVDASERRTGVFEAMGTRGTWHQTSAGVGAPEAAAPRLATPASLNLAIKQRKQFRWPIEEEPFALYDHPTPAQLELADAAARAYGNEGYDPATGACIGLGRPIGVPNVEPEVPEEFHRRFAGIDRARGDSLLYLRWIAEPPPEWFETA